MNSSLFYSLLQKKFPFTPTYKQDVFFQKISIFLTEKDNNTIFVLKGYAGTGKTTVISTIVNNLLDINKKYVLLAPTGRAAKVIANYSNKPAFTIHKKICSNIIIFVNNSICFFVLFFVSAYFIFKIW